MLSTPREVSMKEKLKIWVGPQGHFIVIMLLLYWDIILQLCNLLKVYSIIKPQLKAVLLICFLFLRSYYFTLLDALELCSL